VIRVSHLTKTYGRAAAGGRPALDDVSFEVGKGEVVGLLGPNGAGKTTVMRILACFLAPTRGSAELAGHSIACDTRPVRRAVGYLPEAVPLYPEMRVLEYLGYRAALKGIPRAERSRAIDQAIEPCGLGDRRRQIIGTLSRGYRQRVGLADALLAQPPILILDEPTVGLDPNQIREVRELVRGLGRERTVLLSTHVLPEVEAVASRVIILHGGRVVAAHTPAELRQRLAGGRRLVVEVRPEDLARAEVALAAAAGVASVARQGGAHLTLTIQPASGGSGGASGNSADGVDGDVGVREAVFRAAVAAGLVLRELRAEPFSLEEIFARITTAEPAGGDRAHA
jgi:ABC-2 type transport system ATP-binding protein